MRLTEQHNRHGLSQDEIRLGNTVSESEWRDRYQSARVGRRNYRHADKGRAGRLTGSGAGQLQADSGNACEKPLCEAGQ